MSDHRVKERPLTIALLEPAGRGGMAHFVFGLAHVLADAGHRVVVLTATEYELEDVPREFEVEHVFRRVRTNPLRVLRSLRRVQPHIVHLHGAAHPEFYVPLLLLVRALNMPVVYSAHDVVPRQWPRFSRRLLRLLLALPNRVIAHSEAVAREVHDEFDVASTRIDVVPHGHYRHLTGDWSVEADQTAAQAAGAAQAAAPATDTVADEPDAGEPRVLFFGYILPQKGLLDLIEAFRAVVDAVPRARLCVAGEPVNGFEPYSRRIRALDLEDNVELRLGYVPVEELPRYFSASRVVALPYHSASQSGVLMAAYAFGRPVVATSCPGLAEFVREGSTGLLVPPSDVAALADALVEMLQNPERASRMGRQALRWSERERSWGRVASETLRSYATAVAS